MEQILPDRNISESDPLANVANNSSTLIFRTIQYFPRALPSGNNSFSGW